MDRKEKFEQLAKQWEDKIPNLAKALRSETLHKELDEWDSAIKTTELVARLEERKLIVYVIESSLLDVNWNKSYKEALKDEIQNHKLVIQEYEEELKKLHQS